MTLISKKTKLLKSSYKKSHKKSHKKSSTKKNQKEINNLKHNKNNNKIAILSYNISWESMNGSVKQWALCNNNTDINNPKHFSVCVNNISNVFDEKFDEKYGELDFITLQEATDYKKLIKESSRLKQMKYEVHKSGLDTIVTFWDPKYKLKYKINGEFEEGRPWMATVFNSNMNTNANLCLINIHMGHYNKEEEFKMLTKMIIDMQNEIKTKQNVNYANMRYVISGDFNYNIKEFGDSNNSFVLNNTKFYFNSKHILTCCINRRRHNDHVIDSLALPQDIIIPKVNYMASDHKPILVKLTN